MNTEGKENAGAADQAVALQELADEAGEKSAFSGIDYHGMNIKIDQNGSVTSPKGYTAGGLHCGIKRKRLDLGWLISEVPAKTTGVYTTNLFQAAPLYVTKDSLSKAGTLKGVLVNSGNANACTGEKGIEDAYTMRRSFAQQFEVEEHQVAVVSTGVIGELLPMDKVETGISAIKEHASSTTVEEFEQAILTTDTCKKHIAVQCSIGDQVITIGGAAKGSGMIHPNMATMLGFITTDANIEQESLNLALKQVTNRTFNRITVDGDTSTNDMVLLMANGLAENESLSAHHPDWDVFLTALEIVAQDLAKKIARDGEGATKLIEVQVKGAPSAQVGEAVGKSIVGSSLVKTAVFGTDANWGRIVCAVGYTPLLQGVLQPEKLSVWLGDIQVVNQGLPVPYSEEEAKTYLEQENIVIKVDLHIGDIEAICWGCDLSYDYVRINASYRT